MNKKLEFDGSEESQKRFEILHSGFIVGGSLITTKGVTALRRELLILDKLESISEEFPCGKKIPGTDEPARKLSEGERHIIIDGAEFDMLNNYIGAVPWSTGRPARLAIQTLDWLAMA